MLLLATTSCFAGGHSPQQKQKKETVAAKPKMNILYFHGKQRCITCRAIEKLTKEALHELNQKDVAMQVIDISDPKNETLAQKFKVSWSSLFLERGNKRVDLTQMGFRYAKNRPDEFKRQLKAEIAKIKK